MGNSRQHLVTVQDLTNQEVMALITRAMFFKQNPSQHAGHVQGYVSNLFFEDSTRTHVSFEMAERKLGLEVVSFDAKHSSVNKGETLYDTVLTLSSIGINGLVIRHPSEAYYEPLIQEINRHQLNIHLINGGDGSGQHPSQCLLDLMTIYEEFGYFEGLKVAIIGDLKSSRVAKSNAHLLKQLGAEVYFSGPDYWYDNSFNCYGEHYSLDKLIREVDVMMLLRVQHERHQEGSRHRFDAMDYHTQYGMTYERYQKLKPSAIIMHPGPVNRDVELATDLVQAEKSRFTTQMTNGVYMRMAMLEMILKAD